MLFLLQNIDCDNLCFGAKIIGPCKPQFFYIKMGFKGVYISGTCFHDVMIKSKTEFILFGSRQQLNKCSTKEILVCDDSIELQNCIWYLGAFLDDNLDFKDNQMKMSVCQC